MEKRKREYRNFTFEKDPSDDDEIYNGDDGDKSIPEDFEPPKGT